MFSWLSFKKRRNIVEELYAAADGDMDLIETGIVNCLKGNGAEYIPLDRCLSEIKKIKGNKK